MQLVEQHIMKDERMFELCVLSKNLYNQALYFWRQHYFVYRDRVSDPYYTVSKKDYIKEEIIPTEPIALYYYKMAHLFPKLFPTEYGMKSLFIESNEINFRQLPSATSGAILQLLFKNIKSWQEALKKYNKNPKDFLGKPKIPKYKDMHNICVFNGSNQLRLIDGYIHFPNSVNIIPIKTIKCIKTGLMPKEHNINQVRFIPKNNHIVVEVVYTVADVPVIKYNGNYMGIDPGLRNLATCVMKEEGFFINGKPLKSINSFWNKKKSFLQERAMVCNGIHNTKRIEQLTNKRNNIIKDYMHQASRIIINKAIENDITIIVIGKNDGWKQNIDIGRKNNRHFTNIPFAKLIEMITYKAKLVGIDVILTEESYTSKCSALDNVAIKKHTDEKEYKGIRNRGLFKTTNGIVLNADANGAMNIIKKGLTKASLEDTFDVSDIAKSAWCAPIKVNIKKDPRGSDNSLIKIP